MTSRWPIFFDGASPGRCDGAKRIPRLILIVALATGAAGAATLSGSFTLADSRTPAVQKHRDYSGVVVSFIPVPATVFPPPPRHVTMLQKNKTFLPHVLPVPAGAVVDFPNADPIFHNAFSNYSGKVFDVGLYPPGASRSVRFTQPGVVRVFCNIHSAMSALILVLPSPYFAVSSADGSWSLDLAAGDYEMRVFHERAREGSLPALARRVAVAAPATTLPPVTVSEAGYLPAAHSNKFGRPYEEAADDRSYYPGARK